MGIKESVSLFDLTVIYEGNKVTLNPIKDAAFTESANVEKETSSSLIAYYGAILSSQKKQLANLKLAKSRWEAKKRSSVILDIKTSGEKPTEAAIQAGFDLNPEYCEFQDNIVDVEFVIGVLEQGGVWALKSKSDHIKESIKSEIING